MLNKTPKINDLKNVPQSEQSQNYKSKIVVSLQLKINQQIYHVNISVKKNHMHCNTTLHHI